MVESEGADYRMVVYSSCPSHKGLLPIGGSAEGCELDSKSSSVFVIVHSVPLAHFRLLPDALGWRRLEALVVSDPLCAEICSGYDSVRGDCGFLDFRTQSWSMTRKSVHDGKHMAVLEPAEPEEPVALPDLRPNKDSEMHKEDT